MRRRRRRDRRPRPVPARHRHRPDGRDARADRRGAAARRRGRARRHPVLRRAAAAGPLRLVRARRAASSRPADHRLQRPDPGRGRHHAGDGRPAAPRLRQHRRHQGDDARTSSTSPTCSTSAAPTSSRCRGSSCSATRCSPSAAAGTSAASATSRRDPSPSCTTPSWPGDHAARPALHYDLHPLVDAAFAETNPVPAKWVMERLGLIASVRREPLAALASRRSGGWRSCSPASPDAPRRRLRA